MTCDKRAWTSQRPARLAAKLVGDNAGETFRAYRCDVCHRWHLTSRKNYKQVPRGTGRTPRGPTATTLEELEALAAKMRG